MEKIYKQIDINDIENKTNIGFALGKAYEDIKDYKKSFENYKLGNKIKRESIKYHINDDEILSKLDKFKSNGANLSGL